jgi:hypothetical protein
MSSSESSSSDEEEINKNKKKKKIKVKPLPKKLIIIKNKEKDVGDWMEKWDKGRDISSIPHPFRLLALGIPGRGKTNSLKQLFLRHQSSDKPFVNLIILTCRPESEEWSDTDPTFIDDVLPELDFFNKNEKTCVIFDDFEFAALSKQELKRLSTIMRYVSTHCNVSVMLGFQSFFDCPSICRKCANCFLLYKPTSKLELTTISNRVGLDPKFLKRTFKKHCSEPYDSIMVDLTINTPYHIRKNIYEKLESESDSD